ncbi:hypothetical protein ACJ41O_005624 [Fusarium nematophilum]
MEVVGGAAATIQIADKVIGVIKKTRRVIEDFRSAAGDHETFSQEFASISKIIEFTSDVLQRAAERLRVTGFKGTLKNRDVEPLLSGIQKNIDGAQKILEKHKTHTVKGKLGFVWNKEDLQAAQVKLSNGGIHLTMVLTSLLVDAVVGGSSPLAEVLTAADVEASLKEAVKSVKSTAAKIRPGNSESWQIIKVGTLGCYSCSYGSTISL